ncbi:hypothetical protein HN592_04740 [Candidatus Woesearchaeota archaeon]|jgi:ribonuclease HIII|nr:hypothetical protein [Candidatus Woesearchaeota archaeon]MBT4368520.1 hypothetical protein [Candidatus Woesearchaeota archaeon]MBT4713009.1 hypothetical protein [Candidatus Woesearchaeota archaeon]MBT6639921.1 hypothetical protein [Candidatus Woesearchaeota archaeon]MBT7134093.1 hypothetical protein [Candidatus Woesearchaeota archaeon]
MVLRIGSDESLKGDTFGGMVVAAVKADDATRALLEDMGVKDSKKLTDHRISLMADRIKEVSQVFFVNFFPEEFNKEVALYSLTGVLNKLHTKCTNTLKSASEEVIVDQYPGCKVDGANCLTKAEDQFVEVAAASIVARAEALKQMQELSIRAGFKLPLGSTHVLDALVRLRDKKLDFTKFTKTSFRNVQAVMNTTKQENLNNGGGI